MPMLPERYADKKARAWRALGAERYADAPGTLCLRIPVDLISRSSDVTSQSSAHGQARHQWADLLSGFDAFLLPSTSDSSVENFPRPIEC